MFVSVTIARGLGARLKGMGIDEATFCEEAGIDVAVLSDPVARISVQEFGRAIDAAIRLSGDPALGLSLGDVTPAGDLALLGNLLANCRTMRHSIETYRRFASLITPDATWELVESENTATVTYHQPALGGDRSRFGVELSMALMLRFAEHFVGPRHIPLEARFTHASPLHRSAYERLFRCPMVFRAERNELVFHRELLDVAHLHDDELVWNALHRQAEHLLAEHHRAARLSERVKSMLRYESDLGDVDPRALARRMGFTPRGLRRRLSEEGMPLSTLLNEVKCELACARLRDPSSCIKGLAAELGFSEPSAFHRAFKRWTGSTPAQFRTNADGAARAA